MTSEDELLEISNRLESHGKLGLKPEITDPLEKLNEAVNKIDQSFSGSWLGYHAFVYYEGLVSPPLGAHFSQEWGLMDAFAPSSTTGNWREYDKEEIKTAIYNLANNPDLEPARKLARESESIFNEAKFEILSVLSDEISHLPDEILESIKTDVQKLEPHDTTYILNGLNGRNQSMTRDMVAMGQGKKAPPHMSIRAELIKLHNATALICELGKLARRASSHLGRKLKRKKKSEMVGTKVFIGHGGSFAWRDLKDFISERLLLAYEEFNSVPVAGKTIVARLSEMVESAAIAFIILTGEDEQANGAMNARLNAVHEAGLFQGRLGFNKAIILLEEGCEEFSNIHGLVHIRFPKNNISAKFEDIRGVLEREGIIP